MKNGIIIYRNPTGVYCAADEVQVVMRGLTEIAGRNETGRRIIVVCALGQAARLKLHYDGFGLSVDELEMVTVGSDAMHGGTTERL